MENIVNASVAQWLGERESQEDSYAVKHYPEGTLAVVCDGMGGHQLGCKSSAAAATAFVARFGRGSSAGVAERLREALDAANDAVGDIFRRRGGFGGTTLAAAYIGQGVIWWASVGDSPLFIWRRGRLLRLNADHSMRGVYGEFVQCGGMTHEDAMRRGNVLRSAVTGEPLGMVDISATPRPLLPGDRIILASDGIAPLLMPRMLSEETRALLDTRTASPAALLVSACRELHVPGADNVTVIVMDRD